jgi:hypothetical protein
MKTVTLTFKITIHADQQVIFDYLSDWEKQSDWILFTTVKIVANSVRQQDTTLLATTKLGPISFVDTMTVSDWQPFEKIVVEHTGRIILGKGVFTVQKISADRCVFVWQEVTPLPFGLFGRLGLLLIKPLLNILFGMSLKKLKNNIELLPHIS